MCPVQLYTPQPATGAIPFRSQHYVRLCKPHTEHSAVTFPGSPNQGLFPDGWVQTSLKILAATTHAALSVFLLEYIHTRHVEGETLEPTHTRAETVKTFI